MTGSKLEQNDRFLNDVFAVLTDVIGYNSRVLTRKTRIRKDLRFNSFDIMELFINLDIRLFIDLPDEVAETLDLLDASLEDVARAYSQNLETCYASPEAWKIQLADELRRERKATGEICKDIISIIDGF
jgi:acyl carrier protein